MEYQDTTGTPSPLVRSYYVTGEDTARAAASAHHDAAHDARQTEGSIPVNGPSSTPTHDTRPGPQGRGTPLHRKGRPFTCLDNAVIDRYLSTLTGGEWKVYAVLAMHADAASTCFPSVALLAAETGLTPRQVHNCLRSLQAKRLIAVGERYKGPRDRTSSLYTLLVPPDDQRQDHPQTSGVQEEGVSQTPPRLPQTPPSSTPDA